MLARHPSILSTTLVVISGLLVSGCASEGGLKVDRCADIPPGAIPDSAGRKLWDWTGTQVQSALADQTVLYQADFVGRTDQLSPQAVERIARHVQSGLATNQPWIIDPSSDSQLDAQRANSLSAQLAMHGVAPVSVEIAIPAAIGLTGRQAENALSNSGRGGNNQGNRGGGGGAQGGIGQGGLGGGDFGGGVIGF